MSEAAQTPKQDHVRQNETPQTNNLVSTLNELQLTLQKNQQTQQQQQQHTFSSKPSRDISLQQELDQLVKINETISNVSRSLEMTDHSLNRMINHTEQSNELLSLWIKILSQNHHTYNLLKDKENWQGRSEFLMNHEAKLYQLDALEAKVQSLKQQKKTEDGIRNMRDEERMKSSGLKKDKRIYRTK